MRSYLIRRLLLVIPTLFIVTVTTFTMVRLIPGDVIDKIVLQAAIERRRYGGCTGRNA